MVPSHGFLRQEDGGTVQRSDVLSGGGYLKRSEETGSDSRKKKKEKLLLCNFSWYLLCR